MLKRLYLMVSIVAALSLLIVVGSAAGQKDKQKEKVEKDKAKTWSQSDDASTHFFSLPMNLGEGSYLGVFLEEVTPDRMKELGLSEERGAIIMKVVEGSPAAKAGLKENDVVVSFN